MNGKVQRYCLYHWNVKLSHGCRFVLCASGDLVKVYSTRTEEWLHSLQGHTNQVTGHHLESCQSPAGLCVTWLQLYRKHEMIRFDWVPFATQHSNEFLTTLFATVGVFCTCFAFQKIFRHVWILSEVSLKSTLHWNYLHNPDFIIAQKMSYNLSSSFLTDFTKLTIYFEDSVFITK